MNESSRSVSVVIISWNSERFLGECLKALLAQDYPEYDISVVDNGSADGSLELVAGYFPRIRLLALSQNYGFSRALNHGINNTTGDCILSINPDVIVKPGFITEMVLAINQSDRIGIVAPKLLSADNPKVLDSTGLFIDRCRRPYDRGQGEIDRAQYDAHLEIFGACGAAALYRRKCLEDLAFDKEYFDEDFFAYYEDADFAWRAKSRAWRCIYAPRAIATHVRGWGDTLRMQRIKNSYGPRLALRNRYLMTIKNDDLGNFLIDLPLILLAEVPRLAYIALTRPKILLGFRDLLNAYPSALRKRRQFSNLRTVNSSIIRSWFRHICYFGV
jgi:GT2 family glycosyltransferase